MYRNSQYRYVTIALSSDISFVNGLLYMFHAICWFAQSGEYCYKDHLIIVCICRFFYSLCSDYSPIHLMVGENVPKGLMMQHPSSFQFLVVVAAAALVVQVVVIFLPPNMVF